MAGALGMALLLAQRRSQQRMLVVRSGGTPLPCRPATVAAAAGPSSYPSLAIPRGIALLRGAGAQLPSAADALTSASARTRSGERLSQQRDFVDGGAGGGGGGGVRTPLRAGGSAATSGGGPSTKAVPAPVEKLTAAAAASRMRRRYSAFVPWIQRAVSDLLASVGFLTSSALAVLGRDRGLTVGFAALRGSYLRWKPTVDELSKYLRDSGIETELASTPAVGTRRSWDSAAILGHVQAAALSSDGVGDIRDLALPSNRGWMPLHDPPTKEESLRYMKYATAAYGDVMVKAAEMNARGALSLGGSSLTGTRSQVSRYIGIPEDDIAKLDLDYEGNPEHLRHFVAVDHERCAIVLAIRGTYSLHECIVDINGYSRPFCEREAHSLIADMAETVWEESSPTVLALLRENDGYDLVITGHSLGGGASCLINLLIHSRHRELMEGASMGPQGRRPRVRCFSYAAPPTFYPLDAVPPQALPSCTNFLCGMDVVPFLSADSVRRLLAGIRILDRQVTSTTGWWRRLQYATGTRELSDQVVKSIISEWKSHELPPKAGAPTLVIPTGANLWLIQKKILGAANQDDWMPSYDAKVCDSRLLAEDIGIRINPNMIQDHFPVSYEHALENWVD